MRACSESGFWCDEVLDEDEAEEVVVVVELREDRDEEGDNVREGAF